MFHGRGLGISAKRCSFAAWACIGVFGSGLSSALAYGITTIGTTAGYSAWRWIFIIVRRYPENS